MTQGLEGDSSTQPGGLNWLLGLEQTSWARMLTLSVLGTLAFILLHGWDNLAPIVLVPVIVGVCIGLSSRSRLEALVAGLVSGGVGVAVATVIYTDPFQVAALEAMPSWATKDTTDSLFGLIVVPILKNSPSLAANVAGESHALIILLAVLLLPSVALAAYELNRPLVSKWIRLAVAWVVVATMAVSVVYTLGSASTILLGQVRTNPADSPKGYSNDQVLNVEVYYLMQHGQSFYPAYVKAHEFDMRKAYPVKDGKFVSGSATMMREPGMFYLWKYLGWGGRGDFILWASFICAGLVLAGSFWALTPAIGYRAMFVPAIIFPAMIMHAGATNPLFPEWWALLAMLAGFFALVRGHNISAGVLGLVAILFRETFGVWLLALGLSAAVFALRDKRVWRDVAIYAGLLGAGVVGYVAHVAAGSRYFVSQTPGTLAGYLLSGATRSVELRLLSPMSYLMYPYGFFLFTTLWLVPLGVVGLWVGLSRVPRARLSATIYVVLWIGYLLVMGAPGQYWGQAVIPLLLIGVALLLASLDRLGRASSWLLSLAPRTEAPRTDSSATKGTE